MGKANIYFPQFSRIIDEHKLIDFTNRIVRKNDRLTSDRVFTISAQQGLIPQGDFFNRRIASSQIQGYYLMNKGEFAYNKSYSAEYPVGAVKQLTDYDDGVLSTLYILFEISKDYVNDKWLSSYFESSKWHNEIRKRAAEGARNHGLLNIRAEDFFDIPIQVPTNLEEQRTIAHLFSNLDKLIVSIDKEQLKLKNLKKSSLEKMFPKKNFTTPELRFKGYEDEWVKKTLGECFSERNERSGEGDMISVTISQGIKKAEDLDRYVHVSDLSKYKVVKKGDIAYNSMRMWQGASGYSPYDGILSPAYTVIVPKENIDSLFFSYLFKNLDVIHMFELNSQGLTSDTWNLKYPAFSKLIVSYPLDVNEQTVIAKYFTNLDNHICSREKKLSKFKRIKKALLERMYVSNE